MPEVPESRHLIEGKSFPVSEEERFSVPLSDADARILLGRANLKINEILSSWDDKFRLLEMRLYIRNVPDRERNPSSDKVFVLIYVTRCPACIPRQIANTSGQNLTKTFAEMTYEEAAGPIRMVNIPDGPSQITTYAEPS